MQIKRHRLAPVANLGVRRSTRMKTRTRKFIGIALILAAVAMGVTLQLAGTDVLLFHGEGGQLSTRIEFGFHWSAFVLIAVALTGLLCLVLPPRQHAHPGEEPRR